MVIQTYLPFPPYTSEGTQRKIGTGQMTRENSRDTRLKREGTSPHNRKVTLGYF